jgi:hypothetical protein
LPQAPPTRLVDWLNELKRLPPSADEWSVMSWFAAELQALADIKAQERQRHRQHEALLDVLIELEQAGDVMGHLHLDCASWQADRCPSDRIARVIEDIEALRALLVSYADALAQRPGTFADVQAHTRRLLDLQAQIGTLYQDLDMSLGPQASPTHEPPQSPMDTVGPALAPLPEERGPSSGVDPDLSPPDSTPEVLTGAHESGFEEESSPPQDATADIAVQGAEPNAVGAHGDSGGAAVASGGGRPGTEPDMDGAPPLPEHHEIDDGQAPPVPHPRPPDSRTRALEPVIDPLAVAQLPRTDQGQPAAIPGIAGADGPVPLDGAVVEAATVPELAQAVRKLESGKRPTGLTLLQWALIHHGRLSMAYWLARHLEAAPHPEHRDSSGAAPCPSWLVEALGLALRVQSDVGTIAPRLQDLFTQSGSQLDAPDVKRAPHLMLLGVASALLPSVVAPHTGAAGVLRAVLPPIRPAAPSLAAVCDAVVAFAERGARLAPDVLLGVQDRQEHERQLAALRSRVSEWSETAPQIHMGYAPAARIWLEWLRPGGLIHNLLTPVRANDLGRADWLRNTVRGLSDDAAIKAEVDRMERRLHPHRREVTPTRVLGRLLARTREAIGFASAWLDLEASSWDGTDWRIQTAQQLRTDLDRRSTEVQTVLDEWGNGRPTEALVASATVCRRAFDSVIALLHGGALRAGDASEPDWRRQRGRELLLVPEVPLSEDWEPRSELDEKFAEAVLAALADPERDWLSALRGQSTRRDHWATQRVLEELAPEASDQALAALHEERERAVADCRAALQRDVAATRAAIETAVLTDILAQGDRVGLLGKLESLAATDSLQFGPIHAKLAALRSEVDRLTAQRLDQSRQRLDAVLPAGVADATRARVLAALDRRDASTADEFIALLEAGRGLPEEDETPDRFLEFLPLGAQAIADLLDRERVSASDVIANVTQPATNSLRSSRWSTSAA